jgi:phage FluMu gp28-like protein
MDLSRFNFFCPYQVNWILEDAPLAIAEKSRRIGWTYADAFRETMNRAGDKPAVHWNHWYSSADMTAAEEYIGYCADFCDLVGAVGKVMDGVEEFLDEATGEVAKINVKRIVFANGLKITAGSSNPKFFRSKGGSVGLDEFAFHDRARELYKAAHATARFWGYPLRAWSTHNGPGSYFNGLITQAKAGKLRAKLHRVTVIDAAEQGIVERIRMRKERLADVPAADPKARQEWLDGLRSECPDDDVWNEEYLCIPADDASALLSYELIARCTADNLKLADSVSDLPRQGAELYAGYDVGRKHDFSVLWVAQRVGDVLWTRLINVLDRASHPAQQDLVDALMSNPCVRRICIDEQGVGSQLAEHAMRRFGSRAEGVSLSSPVKASLGLAWRDRFRDLAVRLPGYVNWVDFDASDPVNRIINRRNLKPTRHAADWLKEDLHKTKKSVTAAGNVRLAAESDDDGHADGFWAGALMNEAASSPELPAVTQQQLVAAGHWMGR